MSQLDLNLLKVFRVLIEVKNTRKAAEILHLSQPAVSRALRRLRDYFGDELFVRTAHGLEPTSKALVIGSRLPEAMDQLFEALHVEEEFDPYLYSGKVTIAVNGFIAHWLVPPLIKMLTERAPNMEIYMADWEESTPDQIIDGEIQLAINYFPLELTKQLIQERLGTDDFVVLCRKEHPLQKEVIQVEDFLKYPLASHIVPGWNETKNFAVDALRKLGCQPQVQLSSSKMNIILRSLELTDMLLPCSKLLAATLSDRFRVLKIDPKLEQPSSEFALIYANKSRRNPLDEWLQQCVIDCVFGKLR
ncbi:LysR family transcriptional regulator [Shewanella schlegeliana]|uniref:LysR family transcriptional regulator n=1 Tax=Shewanella schlegeliana TaxID=190308 RepID=A0ABS1SVU7_9GAMM|nr:LysR family transcriptional regulator [Shewanella schlegeliana]MBL4912657.1 LysR family transcriptional regulator [Shewanella schlegeliana]MCL1109833.1 LysR family transcriptional regulator [Shewanella schlegeliana]GIU32803.1 LysR family transcriptional regulator [Shewanella schlegeliana]